MASTKDYLEYVLELLRNVEGITYRKMMGEYLFYKDGVLFGGIYDNRFLIKNTKSNEKYDMSMVLPYDGAKLMYLVDTDDSELICNLVQNTVFDLSK